MHFWEISLNLEKTTRSDLLSTSTVFGKPSRESPSGEQYGFPKYINERISIEALEDSSLKRIEYLAAPETKTRNPPGYTISRAKILCDRRTTCMIRNIPNRYEPDMLVRFVNETHFGTYDFLYLRMDFRSKCNVGYAFINLVDSNAVLKLHDRISGHRWRGSRSSKVAELAYASIQGIENLRARFRDSAVMREDRRFRPRVFHIEGELRGLEKDWLE